MSTPLSLTLSSLPSLTKSQRSIPVAVHFLLLSTPATVGVEDVHGGGGDGRRQLGPRRSGAELSAVGVGSSEGRRVGVPAASTAPPGGGGRQRRRLCVSIASTPEPERLLGVARDLQILLS